MLKQGLTQNAVDLVNAATARAIKGIAGGRIRGCGGPSAATREVWRQQAAKNERNLEKDKKQDKAVKAGGPLFGQMVYDSQNREERHNNNPGLYDPQKTYSSTQYYGNGVTDSLNFYSDDNVEDRKKKRENDKYGALKGKGLKKGSPEMKAKMAKIRSMRGKGMVSSEQKEADAKMQADMAAAARRADKQEDKQNHKQKVKNDQWNVFKS
jgi:hypothetical protein